MDFDSYFLNIKKLLRKNNYSVDVADRNMTKIFENYINSVPENLCIKQLLKYNLNESKSNKNDFAKYTERVIYLLEKLGYTKKDISNKTIDTIKDSYNIEEDEYSCAQLCQDNLEKEQKYKPVNLTRDKIQQIKNNLTLNFHNIDNAALLDFDVSPHAAKITIKVRLFSNLAYLSSDVKTYIKTVHKYLSAFLIQNENVPNVETKITGYSVKFNNLYCTSVFTLPFVLPDGVTSELFNYNSIVRIMTMHLNVLSAFSEQYKPILNARLVHK